MDVFQPPINCSPGSGSQRQVRIIRTPFGDGYSQRTEDGLNIMSDKYSPFWELLTPDQADAIEAFFEQHGADPFLWAPPLKTQSFVWTVQSWQRTAADSVGNETISASFQREYDLF